MVTLSMSRKDISTLSNYEDIKHSHIDLNFSIDFKSKTIEGLAKYSFKCLKSDVSKIILDNKGLLISSITSNNTPLNYRINIEKGEKFPLGTPLEITINKSLNVGDEFTLEIAFRTNENSGAIQWLDKEQTQTKEYPFMFTQSALILSRTLFPNQDTPSVKATYSSQIKCDEQLIPMFSGLLTSKLKENGSNVFNYVQKIPIPSYLVSLACGNVEYSEISGRIGVYADKSLIEKARKELEDLEIFIKAAEDYLGSPYEWGRYDVLILPVGLPYSGMEVPNLTFLFPNIIVGDKSLINIAAAHEITHSWTGNLVTNANWIQFWLNEGFTMFVERKILGMVYGNETKIAESSEGYNALKLVVNEFNEGDSFTSLNPNIENIDPVDAFSIIPYEKGCIFLYYLESLVGEKVFQNVLQAYIKKFRLQSVIFNDFKEVFDSIVIENLGESKFQEINIEVDWNHWLFEPGFPKIQFNFKNERSDAILRLADKFLNEKGEQNDKSEFDKYESIFKLIFFQHLFEKPVNYKVYSDLKKYLELEKGMNAELATLWHQIALRNKHKEAIPDVQKFLTEVGIIKYLRPNYKLLYLLDNEIAVKTYLSNKEIYHPTSRRLIESDFRNLEYNFSSQLNN